MNSGKFNVPIEIEQVSQSATADASGRADLADDANWAFYFNPWAEVVSKGGREFTRLKQQQSELTELLRVPSSDKTRAITPRMRIKMNGRTLGIIAAYDVSEHRRMVEIQCKESV